MWNRDNWGDFFWSSGPVAAVPTLGLFGGLMLVMLLAFIGAKMLERRPRAQRWTLGGAILFIASAAGIVSAAVPFNLQNGQVANATQVMSNFNNLDGRITTLNTTITALQTKVTALETKTAPITRGNGVGTNTEMYITGVNLHIRNGLSETDSVVDGRWSIQGDDGEYLVPWSVNGLGNLIVGYNASTDRGGRTVTYNRSGSHNIVVGDAHGYSGFGGIVSGIQNNITAGAAIVLGGYDNDATTFSTIVGGDRLRSSSMDYWWSKALGEGTFNGRGTLVP